MGFQEGARNEASRHGSGVFQASEAWKFSSADVPRVTQSGQMGELEIESEMGTTIFAKDSVEVMSFCCARPTRCGGQGFAANIGQLDGDDAGGDRQNAVTQDHNGRRQELAEHGLGSDIPIAYGGQGHDRPIHALRDAGEAILFAFDQIHERTQHQNQAEDDADEDGDFPQASPQGQGQVLSFTYEMGQLEHPENA